MYKALRYFLFIYIGFFCADAVISVLNDAISYFIPNLLFSKIREILAYTTLFLSVPYIFTIFYFRLKKGFIYFLPVLYNLVGIVLSSLNLVNLIDETSLFSVFAMELSPHWVYRQNPGYFWVQITLSASQLLVAYFVFKTAYEQKDETYEKDFRFFKAFLTNAFCFTFFLVTQLAAVILMFQVASKGFLTLGSSAVNSVEKIYEKEGKTIHLIPMVHVGSENFYKEVSNIDASKKTLILLEGVRDKKELIKNFSYRNPILSAQEDHFVPKATVKPLQSNIRYLVADLDASEFDPKTRKFINKVSKRAREESFFHYIISNDDFDGNAELATISVDILDRRNVKVLSELKKHEKDYERFYIPWGALHMPQIEREIVNQGYKLAASKPRAVISFDEIVQGKKK